MPVFDQDAAIAALDRLVVIARSDTAQSRRVANFLLAGWNAGDCGDFDVTDLWMLDRAMADDILTVARVVSRRHDYPTAYGDEPQFEQLAADRPPSLASPPGRPARSPPGVSPGWSPLPCPVMTPPRGPET